MADKQRKCLIVDNSGIRPFLFAEERLGLNPVTFSSFLDSVGVDGALTSQAAHEFSFSYSNQPDIFTTPLSPNILLNAPLKNFSISLSSSGQFSLTNGSMSQQFSMGISRKTDILEQGKRA
jgi:hypothetical protein